MSGPKCASYRLHARRDAERERQREANLVRQAELLALNARCDGAEADIEQISRLVEGLRVRFPGDQIPLTVPPTNRPDRLNRSALRSYLQELETFVASAPNALEDAAKQAISNTDFRQAVKSTAKVARVVGGTAEEVLNAYAAGIARVSERGDVDNRKKVLERLLSRNRVKDLKSTTLSRLSESYLSTESQASADAIGVEIRLQIQRANEREESHKANRIEAASLLDQLGSPAPSKWASLARELELTAAGGCEFTDSIRGAALQATAEVKSELDKAEKLRAADILTRSLSDLGYEVAEISNTLFLQGGAVYFRRPGWDKYCVQMLVRPAEDTANFNVVRISEGEENTTDDTAKVDAAIETEWCTHFGQLIGDLDAKGLTLEMRRETPAGKLPIPLARKRDMPKFPGEATSRGRRGDALTQAHLRPHKS